MLGALEGYRNPDGGYGWGIEPDLRSPESQPAGALHAFEVFAEAGPQTSPDAAELCDWLEFATLGDGGLPFARPVTDPAGCAPFWAGADAETSSLHITAAVCSMAYRVAAHDPDVAAHPWLAAATDYCLGEIDTMSETPHAIALMYILHFLDAMVDSHPDVESTLRHVVADHLPANGSMQVAGGLEDERLNPLDFSPYPDRPLRALIDAGRDRRRPRPVGGRPAGRRRLDRRLHQLLADRRPRVARIRHGAGDLAAHGLKRPSCRYPGKSLFRGFHRLDRPVTERHRSR